MSDESPPLKKTATSDFIPIESLIEAKSLLKTGAKTHASAMFWIKDQSDFHPSHLSHFSEKEGVFYLWTPTDFDSKLFIQTMQEQKTEECYFSVSLMLANIFFKAKILGVDPIGLRFKMPDQIFKVQRRKDMRYTIQDGHVLKVAFADPHFPDREMERKVIDISAGGVAFAAKAAEEPVFQSGLVLKNAHFQLRSRNITTDMEVKHVQKLPADSRFGELKIGATFKSIREADTQWIASYVFDETRKYFSKFM